MKPFRWVRGLFRRKAKQPERKSPAVILHEIEQQLAHTQMIKEQTSKLYLAEGKKIDRLRGIEIDLEKRVKGGDAKAAKRLKGTKRALELSRQRSDSLVENLRDYDRYNTMLLIDKFNANQAIRKQGREK